MAHFVLQTGVYTAATGYQSEDVAGTHTLILTLPHPDLPIGTALIEGVHLQINLAGTDHNNCYFVLWSDVDEYDVYDISGNLQSGDNTIEKTTNTTIGPGAFITVHLESDDLITLSELELRTEDCPASGYEYEWADWTRYNALISMSCNNGCSGYDDQEFTEPALAEWSFSRPGDGKVNVFGTQEQHWTHDTADDPVAISFDVHFWGEEVQYQGCPDQPYVRVRLERSDEEFGGWSDNWSHQEYSNVGAAGCAKSWDVHLTWTGTIPNCRSLRINIQTFFGRITSCDAFGQVDLFLVDGKALIQPEP